MSNNGGELLRVLVEIKKGAENFRPFGVILFHF